jgi:hypothetical protein
MSNENANDPIREAHAAIVRAIAELRALNVAVPMALHLAAHSLSYAEAPRPNCQDHAGAS